MAPSESILVKLTFPWDGTHRLPFKTEWLEATKYHAAAPSKFISIDKDEHLLFLGHRVTTGIGWKIVGNKTVQTTVDVCYLEFLRLKTREYVFIDARAVYGLHTCDKPRRQLIKYIKKNKVDYDD